MKFAQCDYGTSSAIADAYLNGDCYYTCWSGDHISKLVPTLLFLVAYIALAVYLRPFWEENNQQLNIKSDPVCLMIKSVLQVTIIGLYKTVFIIDQLAHGITFTILMTVYLVFVHFRSIYNFDRANLMLKCSLICVIYNSILSLIYTSKSDSVYELWLGLQLGGWVVIVICGYLYSLSLPESLLKTIPAKNIGKLFRFSLGDGSFGNVLSSNNISSKDFTTVQNIYVVDNRDQDFGSSQRFELENNLEIATNTRRFALFNTPRFGLSNTERGDVSSF